MKLILWGLLAGLFSSAAFLHAECANDHRSNKNAGIFIADFTITGAQTISATELARITSDFIGSCFDEDSEELGERVRASLQERGYFAATVNSLGFKARDPLAVPKSVTLEAEISDGPRYRLAEIKFVENHAFSSEKLRQQFPLKRGDLFERGKVAGGLESLRKLYGTRGFLDFTSIPETKFASNATINLNVSIEEGPQYHMGKLDIVADKEIAARLRAAWKLEEGDVYDQAYIDQYLQANRDWLPVGFSRSDFQGIQNCPDAVVELRVVVDSSEDTAPALAKNVPCEEHRDVSK